MKTLIILVLLLAATPTNGELYTWKDANGTSHYTNLPDTVPPKYRKRVKVLQMPGDQNKEQAPGQRPAPASTPAVSLPMPPPPPAAPQPQPAVAPQPAASQPAAAPQPAVSQPPPVSVPQGGKPSRRERRARTGPEE